MSTISSAFGTNKYGGVAPSYGFGDSSWLSGRSFDSPFSTKDAYEGSLGKFNLGGKDKFGAKEFLSAFASGLRKGDQDRYRNYGESSPFMSKGFEGGGGRILENLGVVYPQQQGSMFIPGQEGKKSQWGAIGGALLGAASGFIPGVGLAGAALGSQLGGGLGGALFD
jgi:hypothetical protein